MHGGYYDRHGTVDELYDGGSLKSSRLAVAECKTYLFNIPYYGVADLPLI